VNKALVCYHHGLGDVILLTPHLRELFKSGYMVDLMCRVEVKTSHLLDECPYIDNLIPIPNPWDGGNYQKAIAEMMAEYSGRKKDYDFSCVSTHSVNVSGIHKIDITSMETGIECSNKEPEVFIPENVESHVLEDYGHGEEYIHVHTQIENHPVHSWDAGGWIQENIGDMQIIDTGSGGSHERMDEDINYTFAVAKHAKHRVYSSSVMVHACEAMDKTIDIINYGKEDRKVWPLKQGLVKNIRECGEMLRG
jgi:hypothetical protein